MQSLDFNSINRPTLELTMRDDAHTVIRVGIPRESMVEELQSVVPDMRDIVGSGSPEGVRAVYDMAAKAISCNRDYITVTGSDLRDKFGMELEDVVLFFRAYLDFLSELTKAKN